MRVLVQRTLLLVIAGLLGVGCGDGGGGGGSTATTNPTSVAIGAPATVTVDRVTGEAESGARTLTLNIAAAGNYECRAHAQEGATALDAQMRILQGTTEVAFDSDSGENNDALITRALTPGAYSVKVWEWMGRPASITVTCNAGPAAPPNPSSIAFGTPVNVNVVQGEGAGSQIDLALNVPAAGRAECTAHAAAPDGSALDGQMSILQGTNQLATDSDSGPDTDALITQDVQPGAYTVRVWEWMHRAATITVTCNFTPGGAAAGGNVAGGALALGTASSVNVPAGETAAGEFDLVIEGEGSYQCSAAAAAPDGSGLDAELAIMQGETQVGMDRDSGGNMNALLTQALTAGSYKVRVWEWQHRAATITVTCGLAPPPG